ncbi:MAG: hypothetical protein ACYTG6_16970, partial [Planctomycetota bacterium]
MRSLRALTWLLVLLVLVPAGVLAWLGFRSTEAWDAAVEARIRRDLDDASAEARRLTEEVLLAADRGLRDRLEELADQVRRDLPRVGFQEALHDLTGRNLWLAGEGRVPTPVVATLRGVRLRGADGAQLYPATYVPDRGPDDVSLSRALFAYLRHESDRLLYRDGDAEAAAAVWQDARTRVPGDRLRATCDVEAALVRLRAGDERGLASRLANELESVWSRDLLWQVGRPAVRLWMTAARERFGTYADLFYEALRDGRLDTVPLTESERTWIRSLARSAWESRRLEAADDALDATVFRLYDLEGWTPPNFARAVDVARGAQLECWIGGADFWAGIRDRVRDLGDWGPTEVMVESGEGTTGTRLLRHAGVEVGRSFRVEGPNGLVGHVSVSHAQARELLDERRTRRVATLAGVASLFVLMIVGLVLV